MSNSSYSHSRIFSERPVDVGNWRAFLAVAETLNFRAASERLALTQSAISRQVKALEDELGIALFVRSTRMVQLTPAGQSLVPVVARMLQSLDQTVGQIRSRGQRRRVSITSFASFASLWLLPRLEHFQRRYPDIDIRLSSQDETIDLDSSDLDLALRYGPPQKASNVFKLFDEEVLPVISSRLAAQLGRGFQTQDLLKMAWIEDSVPSRVSQNWLSWRAWLEAHRLNHLSPKSWLYMDFASQMIQSAVAGQGVALGRSPLVLGHIQQGLLEPVLLENQLKSPWSYWLVLRETVVDREEVALFKEWLLEEAKLTRQSLRRLSRSHAMRAPVLKV